MIEHNIFLLTHIGLDSSSFPLPGKDLRHVFTIFRLLNSLLQLTLVNAGITKYSGLEQMKSNIE